MNDRIEDLQVILDRLAEGDPAAKEEMIKRAQERLRKLARGMLRNQPRIAAKAQTDDLLQTALLKLYQSLDTVKPASVDGFMRLAAKKMRYALIDLARHHYGPHGDGRHQVLVGGKGDEKRGHLLEKQDSAMGPRTLAAWNEFHEKIEELPDDEKKLCDFLYYQAMPHSDVARLLGVTERTVQRQWRAVRLKFAKLLGVKIPKS
jgi:RNA polymerase sigma-70 factor (ECF subfamily)